MIQRIQSCCLLAMSSSVIKGRRSNMRIEPVVSWYRSGETYSNVLSMESDRPPRQHAICVANCHFELYSGMAII